MVATWVNLVKYRRANENWQALRFVLQKDLEKVKTQRMRSASPGMCAHPTRDINLGLAYLHFFLKPSGWSFYTLRALTTELWRNSG
jgi:hypothetical protein